MGLEVVHIYFKLMGTIRNLKFLFVCLVTLLLLWLFINRNPESNTNVKIFNTVEMKDLERISAGTKKIKPAGRAKPPTEPKSDPIDFDIDTEPIEEQVDAFPNINMPRTRKKTKAEILEMQTLLPLHPDQKGEKIFVIPSYATSGSTFIRNVFANATDTSQGAMYDGGDDRILFRNIKGRLNFFSETPWPAPINSSTLMKTHHPSVFEKEFANLKLDDHFAGIVLLVRNPADCVLRNAARWPCNNRPNSKQCQEDSIGKYCSSLQRLASDWKNTYQWWFDKAKLYNLPIFIFRYEDGLLNSKKTFQKLIEFMWEEDPNFVLREDWLDEALQYIKPPSYTLGETLLRCNAGSAKKLVDTVGLPFLNQLGYMVNTETEIVTWTEELPEVIRNT